MAGQGNATFEKTETPNMRLSIIVTIFKAAQYIEQCIRSFYHQDIPIDDYEVIAVDNASPDSSMSIVRELQKEYQNIKIVTLTKNHCAGGGRNAGLRYASGEYVMFVDSDDYLYSNVLGNLLKNAEESQVDFLHFDYDMLHGNTIEVLPQTKTSETMGGSDLLFMSGFPWQQHIVVWRKLFRRTFLLSNKLFFLEDIILDDDDYVFRTYAAAKKAKHIARKVYVYRSYEGSTVHQIDNLPYVNCLLVQANKLLELKYEYQGGEYNALLIPTIEGLLRFNLDESFRCYHSFDKENRSRARKMIKSALNKGIVHYMSRKKLLLFQLGFY